MINLSIPKDEHEMRPRITVVGVGGAGGNAVNNMIRSNLIGCEFVVCNTDAQALQQSSAPRIEETFELVRNRLEASGFDKVAGRRVVLTGGACQLHGAREFAGLILDKQVRMGRPQRVAGLAEATGGPAFATTAGLLHFALSERAEIAGARHSPRGSRRGVLGRLGYWLRDNF